MGVFDKFKAKGTARDPVCHMDVAMANPPGGTHAHAGTTYFFCSPGCRARFAREPEKFLAPGHKGSM